MFVVPGWAVSADALKTQQDPSSQTSPNHCSSESLPKPSRKRKRKHGQPNGVSITGENLAEMWKKHVEGGSKKRVRQERDRKSSSEKTVKKPAPEAERDGDLEDSSQDKRKGSAQKPSAKRSSASLKLENAVPLTKSHKPMSDTPGHVAAQDDAKDLGKVRYEERMRKKQEKAVMKAAGIPKASEVLDEGLHTTAPIKSTNRKHAKSKRAPQPKESDRDLDSETPQKALSEQKPQTDSKSQLPPSNPHKPITSTAPKSLPSPPRPSPPPSPPPPPSNLTPLQRSMQAKLLSSRFRHLNQTLYTSPSNTALQLFTSNPSAYSAYHAGFRAQVAVWPQNPIETFISDIKQRGIIRRPGLKDQKHAWKAQKRKGGGPHNNNNNNNTGSKEGKKKGFRNEEDGDVVVAEALPRTNGICTIADLGCGDAQLAGSLQQQPSFTQLNLKIHSFDLSPGDGPYAPLITVVDITKLPLRAQELDLAICCLSLMGTNWVDVVAEAARVVRSGGEVWVAETKSRFVRRPLNPEKVGKKGNKPVDDDEEEQAAGILPEIDSDPDIDIDILGNSSSSNAAGGSLKKKRRREKKQEGEEEEMVDISPFVAVWRRRGFELKKGEVDAGNKMFVRMKFVRRQDAGPGQEGSSAGGGGIGGIGSRKRKFIEHGSGEMEEVSKAEEAKVLKPCVYKLR